MAAYTSSALAGPVVLDWGARRGMAATGPAPGLISPITPAATAALMTWWRQ